MNRPQSVAETLLSGSPRRRRAFTVVELLVVIAVIAILAGLLLPSLSRSKSQAQGAFCLNNTRQLILACLMYCDDNKSCFPYNLAGDAARTNINWVSDVLNWEPSPDNTNTVPLTEAALGSYVAKSAAIFHCPSDTALSAIQRSAGWSYRVRSYSMNASVGDVGEFTQSGFNTFNPDYVQFFKHSSVPQPAQIFVFMEEHPDTIKDGYFLNKADSNQWDRLPASYHNGSATISFVDDHAELHHWLNASTTPPS